MPLQKELSLVFKYSKLSRSSNGKRFATVQICRQSSSIHCGEWH